MNLWKTLGLLLVFGLLLGYSLKYERGESPDWEADRKVVQLLGFKAEKDIKEIAVKAADGSFTLELAPKKSDPPADPKAKAKEEPKPIWHLTAPIKGEADASSTEAFVKTLLSAKATHCYGGEEAKGVSDSDTGLSKPAATLTLKGANGRTAVLNFGLKTPKGDGYFAQVKDSKNLLVFAQFYVDDNVAAKKLNDLRDKTLLAFSSADVKSLTLKYPTQTLKLTKNGANWELESGAQKLAADSATVDGIVSAVSSARIDKFVESQPKSLVEFGLDKPRIEVTLGLAKGEVGVLVGASKAEPSATPPSNPNQPPQNTEKLYLQRKGETEVLQVAASLYDSLLKTPKDLRDKVVLAVNTANATKLTYTVDGKQVAFEKAATPGAKDTTPVWQLKQPLALPADASKVQGILSNLRSLQAADFVDTPGDLAQYGLDKPQARVEVTQGATKLPVLLIGKPAGDGANVYAKRDNAPGVVKVGATILKDLETRPNRLRDLLVLKLDRAKVKEIALRAKGRDLIVLTATGASEWKWRTESSAPPAKDAKAEDKAKAKEAAKAKKADAGKVSTVLTALEEIRADEWIADKVPDLGVHGLKPEDVEVIATVTMADGTKHTVYVGRDPKSGSLAAFIKLKGRDTVYKSDHGMLLTTLNTSDFEPMPEQPPMDPMMGMPPGGGPPPPE